MKTIKRYVRLYKVFIAQFFKSLVQSKADFLIGLCGFFFTQITGIAFLYLVFEQIPVLEDWSLDQLIFIYGFAQIPRGIDHLLTDNIWMVAWWYVVNGKFDRYMLRPMNLFLQVIFEKLQPDALGELLVGIILIVISLTKGIVIVDALHVLVLSFPLPCVLAYIYCCIYYRPFRWQNCKSKRPCNRFWQVFRLPCR